MRYHLELGSGGHSFGGKAIVVNSKTGTHMTRTPEDMGKATERLEKAEKKGEDVVWNKALRMSEKAYNKEQWHAKRAKKAPASQKRESEAEAEARRKLSTDRLREWATKIHSKGEEAREAHRAKVEEEEDELDFHPYYHEMPGRKIATYLRLRYDKSHAWFPEAFLWHPITQTDGTLKVGRYAGLLQANGDIDTDPDKEVEVSDTGGVYQEDKAQENKVIARVWARDRSTKKLADWAKGVQAKGEKARETHKAKEEAKEEARVKAEAKAKEDAKKAKSDAKKADIKAKALAQIKKAEVKVDDEGLQEFMDTAPEDVAGHFFGKPNKKGMLQRGIISQMVGDVDFPKQLVEACAGTDDDASYARLVGALYFLNTIANKQMDAWRPNKANTFYKTSVGSLKGKYSEAESMSAADKDWNMCCRVLVNHHKLLSYFAEPKNLEKSLYIHMLLPGQKALNVVKSHMPSYFQEYVGHTSGMSGARDNYKWEIGVQSRKSNADKVEYERKLEECSNKATALLADMKKALIGGAYLYLDKGTKAKQEVAQVKAAEKAEERKAVRASAGIQIPEGIKNRVRLTLTADNLYDIGLALTGDEAGANKIVADWTQHIGRSGYFWKARKNFKVEWIRA